MDCSACDAVELDIVAGEATTGNHHVDDYERVRRRVEGDVVYCNDLFGGTTGCFNLVGSYGRHVSYFLSDD